MTFRRKISWIRVALALGLALSGPLTASAQSPRGGVAEPYTPAKDATDLKAVLFNWMRNMGMLRGHDERDMVATLEYQGKGTIQVGRTTVHAHEISCEHQLPDIQSADSVRLHASERTNVLEHRGAERAVRLERRHARCGDRSNEGEGDPHARDRRGAAHPPVGKSSGRS